MRQNHRLEWKRKAALALRKRAGRGDSAADHRTRGGTPTYGYRRITAILNRQLRATGASPVNHERVYRIMQAQNLLLIRSYRKPEIFQMSST